MKKVVSLGENCEVSFQIERYVNKLNASLFSWAYIYDVNKFLEALDNLDNILKNEISFAHQTTDMFWDQKYNITFHGRTAKEELFDENGEIREEMLYSGTIDELKSRISYLTSKFLNDFETDVEKIYIQKLSIDDEAENWEEKTITYIERLFEYFNKKNKNGQFKLIIVIEQKKYSPLFEKIQNERLFIRTLAFFSPVDNTQNGADNYGWKKIFDEFLEERIEKKVDINEAELIERMQVLEENNKKLSYENKKLREMLEKERLWEQELFEAKSWIENQYLNYIK